MKVIDPGHVYELDHLDGNNKEILTFVKREGPGFPGNVSHHEGTNLQEVLRALIDRVFYVDNQIHDETNLNVIVHLRNAIANLETRAAVRHNRLVPKFAIRIEDMPTCPICGHVGHQCKEKTS